MQAWNAQKQLETVHKGLYMYCNASNAYTSQEVPAYPAGHEQNSTAEALWSPWREASAICMENEWSLHTQHKHTHMQMKYQATAQETNCSLCCCISTCKRRWALCCKTPWPSCSSDWLKQSRSPFGLLAARSPRPGSSLEEAWCDWYLVRTGTPAGQTFHPLSWALLPGRETEKTEFLMSSSLRLFIVVLS